MCNWSGTNVFVSGGFNTDTVERYDLAKDEWTRMPSMNVGRYTHASCALGRFVYVFHGTRADGSGYLGSIERLDATALKKWDLIEDPT